MPRLHGRNPRPSFAPAIHVALFDQGDPAFRTHNPGREEPFVTEEPWANSQSGQLRQDMREPFRQQVDVRKPHRHGQPTRR